MALLASFFYISTTKIQEILNKNGLESKLLSLVILLFLIIIFYPIFLGIIKGAYLFLLPRFIPKYRVKNVDALNDSVLGYGMSFKHFKFLGSRKTTFHEEIQTFQNGIRFIRYFPGYKEKIAWEKTFKWNQVDLKILAEYETTAIFGIRELLVIDFKTNKNERIWETSWLNFLAIYDSGLTFLKDRKEVRNKKAYSKSVAFRLRNFEHEPNTIFTILKYWQEHPEDRDKIPEIINNFSEITPDRKERILRTNARDEF